METEIVFGAHTIREILRKGARPCREITIGRSKKDPAAKEILKLARERKVRFRLGTRQHVERLAPGGNHQGFAMEVSALSEIDLEDFLATAKIGKRTLWVGLDGITDPHNLGAVIRNAACFGATAVVTPSRDSARLTPLVQKIASGATEYVPVVQAGTINQAIHRLRREDFFVYAADVDGDPLDTVDFQGPALVLIGAEGRGLKKKTRDLADGPVGIPQAPEGVASLNASAASAVLLYMARRALG